MNINFAFDYGQYVKIKVFDLNCEGRVNRCISDGGPNYYSVCFALNGEIKHVEFYEDELEAIA